MGENLKMRELRERVINLFNDFPVPIEAKRLILLEILGETEKEANRLIQKEIEEFKQKQKSEESEETENAI